MRLKFPLLNWLSFLATDTELLIIIVKCVCVCLYMNFIMIFQMHFHIKLFPIIYSSNQPLYFLQISWKLNARHRMGHINLNPKCLVNSLCYDTCSHTHTHRVVDPFSNNKSLFEFSITLCFIAIIIMMLSAPHSRTTTGSHTRSLAQLYALLQNYP